MHASLKTMYGFGNKIIFADGFASSAKNPQFRTKQYLSPQFRTNQYVNTQFQTNHLFVRNWAFLAELARPSAKIIMIPTLRASIPSHGPEDKIRSEKCIEPTQECTK